MGGGIYFYRKKNELMLDLVLINTIISNNFAYIGGGIRIINAMSIKLQNAVIEENRALYGQNEFSFASGLRMYLLDSQTGEYE